MPELFHSYKSCVTRFSTLLLLTLQITSCTQAPPPKYNALETLILHETFNAISEKNYQLAINKLERMQELRPNAAIIYTLKSIQEENLAIQNARGFLVKKELISAKDSLNQHIQYYGISEKLLEEKNKIENMIKIENYQRNLPIDDADKALEAVANLPSPEKFLTNSREYKKWRDDQIQMAEHLAEVEKNRLIHEIMDEMDYNLVTSSNLYLLNIAQIGTLNINQTTYNNWLHLIFGLENISTSLESQKGRFLFNGVDHWQSTFDFNIYNSEAHNLDSEINVLTKSKKKITPATLSGLFIHTKQLFRDHNYLKGYLEYKNLLEITPNMQAMALSKELSSSLNLHNNSSGLPLSIDSVLNHIYTW